MLLRAIVVMVAASSLLAIASPAEAASLEDCGQRVIRDWYSGGRVDRVYPLPCYRAAIRALPDDVLQYTDAGSAIERALEAARHGRTETPSNDEQASASSSSPPVAETSETPRPAPRARVAAKRAHDLARFAVGPVHDARAPGIPYPLIAIAVLSAVLLVSGVAAGLAHRRR
jgi:hypothetical protein